MAELLIHYDDGREVPVEIPGDCAVIGRDASCDITLDDAITSRNHARLVTDEAGHLWIEDLESKNGTTVNDKLVARSRFRTGDRIGIGGCVLTLVGGPPPTNAGAPDAPADETFGGTTSAWDARHRIDLSQQRLEKLYELNERLTGRFDRDELLNEVLDICVELLRFERAGVAIWAGGSKPPEWVALRNLRLDKPEEFRISRSLVHRALHNAERILVNDTAGDEMDPTASMISNNIQSAMCVPMAYHDDVHGVLYGDRVSSTGGYGREDIDFFAALGRLGAMGLANVRLHEEIKRRQQVELQVEWARQIQLGLLPSEPWSGPGLDIVALNDPGQHISGDYYDYFLRPDGRIAIVIADVMGKGIPASLLTANLQAVAHVVLHDEDDVAAAVNRINALICRNVTDSRFITAMFGLLDPKTGVFDFCNAGHMPPLLLAEGQPVVEVEVDAALPLGIEEDYVYHAGQLHIADRPATLFQYTDGVPDAVNDSDERFGEQRMRDVLAANAHRAPADLLDRVRTTIRQFTRSHAQIDDITMVALQLR